MHSKVQASESKCNKSKRLERHTMSVPHYPPGSESPQMRLQDVGVAILRWG